MKLKILSADGRHAELECDSVHLNMAADTDGEGEGSVGIRKGHADALIALAPGGITAYDGGEEIYRARLGRGFASVKQDTVTVETDGIY